MEAYLQTAWGDQWNSVDIDIVRTVIKRIREGDDDHGAFWVGRVKEEESVLEVHKDRELIGVFEDEPGTQYKGRGEDWDEVETLFQMFLSDEMKILKSRLNRLE
ncbi:MAG TPA: hypothetical protein VEW65_08225 [Chryseolinea sp.]|nr:hypothetical protein [Chryseolinea sp.]